jgi:hypothetical protein
MAKAKYKVVVTLNPGVASRQIKVVLRDGNNVEVAQIQNVAAPTDFVFDNVLQPATLAGTYYLNGGDWVLTTPGIAGVQAPVDLQAGAANGITFVGYKANMS